MRDYFLAEARKLSENSARPTEKTFNRGGRGENRAEGTEKKEDAGDFMSAAIERRSLAPWLIVFHSGPQRSPLREYSRQVKMVERSGSPC